MSSDMRWLYVCGVVALTVVVQGTYTQHRTGQGCDCNRKSRHCMQDAEGLRCLDCRGNTAGRRCERCEDGFFRWVSGHNCRACQCSPSGSAASTCDSRGRCSCKEGATGDKCDRCANGALLGPGGCTEGVLRDQPVDPSTSCFCYGHASSCGVAHGYAIHPIDSNFTDGPEGWQVSTGHGVMSSQVQFRWVPVHEDLEVISQNSLPTYLNAPARYLGNQVLSYGQNLSFLLRLDRGVRHPSTNDVVLEGAGLRVGAALGELRSIIPCGQKIPFSFRLDERPGSGWRPRLPRLQFQALLHNLTAVKIRTTFGEDGRGYLDNVRLMSARRGPGGPAPWARSCECEAGFQGAHCERCAAGFTRTRPADGAFGTCRPCDCKAGSCDPDTGDCFSADETPRRQTCPDGYYSDPARPLSCVKCPCPEGVACSLAPGALQVQCNLCPPGITGYRCQLCRDGFYGDPLGEQGPRRPCTRCSCDGRGDSVAAAGCDPFSGECLKCVNDSRGGQGEACPDGFYRDRLTDTCQACNCDLIGSAFSLCSAEGQCTCREGYQGRRCHRSTCPSCFQPITMQVEGYAAKLRELENLFSGLAGGSGSTQPDSAQLDSALRAAGQLVTDLQETADRLRVSERGLQRRLAGISDLQLEESQDIQSLAQTAERLGQEQTTYAERSAAIQALIDQMKKTLRAAKAKLQAADIPQGDQAQDDKVIPELISRATKLAEGHLVKAEEVEQSAGDALRDSEKSLGLMRSLMSRENQVKEKLGDLNTMYNKASSQVKAMESQATRLSGQAGAESKMAGDILKGIGRMERGLGVPLQVDELVSRLDSLKDQVSPDLSAYDALQENVDQDKALVQGLLGQGARAQQVYDGLLVRVNAAKDDTEGALSGINSNVKELDNTLASLRGFDVRVDESQTLANAAVARLPGINGTIQEALRSHAQTTGILDAVAEDFSSASDTLRLAQGEVANLESRIGSLGSSGTLLTDATKLRRDVGAMATRAKGVQDELDGEMRDLRTLQGDAQQAVSDAEAASDNAKDTKDAVATTLRNVQQLLNTIGQSGSVDENRITELEQQLANAERQVQLHLKPRLQDMEDQEAAQRRLLGDLNGDIGKILSDIANLEDILGSLPAGCYNSGPAELA